MCGESHSPLDQQTELPSKTETAQWAEPQVMGFGSDTWMEDVLSALGPVLGHQRKSSDPVPGAFSAGPMVLHAGDSSRLQEECDARIPRLLDRV